MKNYELDSHHRLILEGFRNDFEHALTCVRYMEKNVFNNEKTRDYIELEFCIDQTLNKLNDILDNSFDCNDILPKE